MARQKQPTPLQREPSSEVIPQYDPSFNSPAAKRRTSAFDNSGTGNGKLVLEQKSTTTAAGPGISGQPQQKKQAGLPELVICVGGIYASFLSWGVLQERITTISHPSLLNSSSSERFAFPIFLNTVQSLFAFLTGYLYLYFSRPAHSSTPPIIPTRSLLGPLLLVSITSSLASPFGYASLAHLDYLTFILAKSCKLLPVMALHLTIFRKRYPLYKYAVVALVTAGVAVFTLHHPSSSKKRSKAGKSSGWGLMLLGINLLFDGLTNSTQDHIFATYQPFSGPQMMCAQNLMNTALTLVYLVATPWLMQVSPVVGSYIGLSPASGGELASAVAFLTRHPQVTRDVLLFSLCGAVGQVFIFYTLSTFSSLLLVTVTVTRKMLTMILSVLWFGHRLQGMQWVGVGLVFGGVGAEGYIQKREKAAKEAKRRKEL